MSCVTHLLRDGLDDKQRLDFCSEPAESSASRGSYGKPSTFLLRYAPKSAESPPTLNGAAAAPSPCDRHNALPVQCAPYPRAAYVARIRGCAGAMQCPMLSHSMMQRAHHKF
eukprot:6171983-Pleurochrysis_carterae.AAC.2